MAARTGSATTCKMLLFVALAALGLGTADALWAESSVLMPRARSLVRGNPAYWESDVAGQLQVSATPPLGLVQAALPPRNPAGALEDLDYNVLALLDSILHPDVLSTTSPELLDGIDVVLRRDSLSVVGFVEEDGVEREVPLSLAAYGGARSPELAEEGALPEPIVLGRLPYLPFTVEYSVYSGGLGIELAPGRRLERDLAEGELRGDTEYSLSLAAAGQAGVSVAPIVPFEAELLDGTVRAAARPLASYDPVWAYGEAAYALEFREGRAVQEGSAEAQYAYPGEGYGVGVRLDLGALYERRRWSVGLGLLNVGSFTRRVGRRVTLDAVDDSDRYESDRWALAPEARLSAGWYPPLPVGRLGVYSELGAAEYVTPELGAIYERMPVFVRTTLGWDDGIAFDAAFGARLGRAMLELESTTHAYPFTGGRAAGFRVTFSWLRGEAEEGNPSVSGAASSPGALELPASTPAAARAAGPEPARARFSRSGSSRPEARPGASRTAFGLRGAPGLPGCAVHRDIAESAGARTPRRASGPPLLLDTPGAAGFRRAPEVPDRSVPGGAL